MNTLVIYKSRVRLYGIDTPESRTRDLDEKARGKLATAFLKEAVDCGKQIVIQTKLKDSRGKFGRVLGEVIIDGVNINVKMVDENHAVAYYGQSKEEIIAEHRKNREQLIKRGLYVENN